MAAMGAVLQFNEGASSKHLVMEKAGISHGEHSVSASAHKDKTRVHFSRWKASKNQKLVRRKLREGKHKAEEERRKREGTSYCAGKFNDIDPLQDSSGSEDDIPLAQVCSKS